MSSEAKKTKNEYRKYKKENKTDPLSLKSWVRQNFENKDFESFLSVWVINKNLKI